MTQTVILTCDSCGEETLKGGSAWTFILIEVAAASPRVFPDLKHKADLCPRCYDLFVSEFRIKMSELLRHLGKKREAA